MRIGGHKGREGCFKINRFDRVLDHDLGDSNLKEISADIEINPKSKKELDIKRDRQREKRIRVRKL